MTKFAKHTAERRDVGRGVGADALLGVGEVLTPDRIVAGRELLECVRSRLSPEEREIADRRGRGEEWNEIASAMGGTAEARRKQFARAIGRLTTAMGIDEDEDD